MHIYSHVITKNIHGNACLAHKTVYSLLQSFNNYVSIVGLLGVPSFIHLTFFLHLHLFNPTQREQTFLWPSSLLSFL
jgi:hypothetical protein